MRARLGACGLGVAALSTFAARPAPAQETEPLPRLHVVPIVELNFRGQRAETESGPLEFGNGPAFGLRLHGWLSPTFGLALHGSFARVSHCAPDLALCTQREVTLSRGLAELSVRVKPGVPGYFIVGGGVTYVAPDADAFFGEPEGFEPTLTGGLGIDFRVTERGGVRLEARLYLQIPQEQEGRETEANQIDFAFGIGYAHRL